MKVSALSMTIFATPFYPCLGSLRGNTQRKSSKERELHSSDDAVGSPGTPPPTTVTNCFSALSSVEVFNRGSVAMKDLAVGDHVLTMTGDFEPVYAFAHRAEDKEGEFIILESDCAVLEITGSHLIFVQGKSNPVRGDFLKVGDILAGRSSSGCEITRTSTVSRTGMYSPMTPSGTIIVNGIHASNYVAVQEDPGNTDKEFAMYQGRISTGFSHHDISHIFTSPFRTFCLSTSSGLCQVYNEHGIPYYIFFGLEYAKFVREQRLVIEAALMATLGSFFLICYGLEMFLGPYYVYPVLAVILGFSIILKTLRMRSGNA